jgi:hypothetical protein
MLANTPPAAIAIRPIVSKTFHLVFTQDIPLLELDVQTGLFVR